MDKYKKLQTDIEKVVTIIDKEIGEKQAEINSLGKEINVANDHVKELEEQLKDTDEKRKIIEAIENSNIIAYIFKNWLKTLNQEYKEYIKNKNWFIIIAFPLLILWLIVICAVIILGSGLSGFLILTILGPILFIGGEAKSLIKLYNLKKAYTFVGLSNIREDIIKSIGFYRENIEENINKSKVLYAEVQKLQQEKDYFVKSLESVIEKREQVLEQVAFPLLDEFFSREDISEVIARIRAKKDNATASIKEVNNG